MSDERDDQTPRKADAEAFLTAVFGRVPPRGPLGPTKIALWIKSSKQSMYMPNAPAAAGYAAGRRTDVFVSVALAPKDLGKGRRIRIHDAAGIGGLWADIDVEGGPEKKMRRGAPDFAAAADLSRFKAEPTLLVCSGYGLQAWWLFDEPWTFSSTDERDRAAQIALGWLRVHDDEAKQRGFDLDPTQDLARLMRVPGTVNAKGGLEALVRGWPDPIAEQDGPRYSLEDLAPIALERAPTAPPPQAALHLQGDGVRLDPAAEVPYSKMEALLANDEVFARTWRHQRREAVSNGWTLSEYDLALAARAALVGWTDQEIANLIIVHRRQHGDLDKALRPDNGGVLGYVARTIAKAKVELDRSDRERDREDALDELEAHVEAGAPSDPETTIATFNRLLPASAPAVKELVKDGTEPGEARYTLVLANGLQVRLGGSKNLLNQDRFREAFVDVTNKLILSVKRQRWETAMQALLDVAVTRESPDDTPEGRVVDWLSRYLFERLPPRAGEDYKDEACRKREPFRDGEQVYVFAASVGTFVRAALRTNVLDREVKEMLRAAGFERTTVRYHVDEERISTRSYYAGPAEIVE